MALDEGGGHVVGVQQIGAAIRLRLDVVRDRVLLRFLVDT
jgi:hypothetical protein